jgi:hypothetical protein
VGEHTVSTVLVHLGVAHSNPPAVSSLWRWFCRTSGGLTGCFLPANPPFVFEAGACYVALARLELDYRHVLPDLVDPVLISSSNATSP